VATFAASSAMMVLPWSGNVLQARLQAIHAPITPYSPNVGVRKFSELRL
jgi:hypothetical protein